MSDDLIVPIRLHTLVVNRLVRLSEPFQLWQLDFKKMIDRTGPVENPTGHQVTPGVQVQWELPEALAAGHYDPQTGETTFPLVPNRWLVVRYSGNSGTPSVAGWVVHSDYLERADAGYGRGTSRYLTTRRADGEIGAPERDSIGRRYDLRDGPWAEPPARDLFLTAVGPGLPAFAAYANYHKNVFCFHDLLEDLPQGPDTSDPEYPDDPPTWAADTVLSYQVIGWYSDRGTGESDILYAAQHIPGLLPPDTSGTAAVAEALHWAVPGGMEPTGTVYSGTALGIEWKWQGAAPISKRPVPLQMKVGIGQSTAEAAAALVAEQSRSARTGDLVRALFEGTIDTYGTPDGDVDLAEATREAWFEGVDGGHHWEVVPEGTPTEPPPTPSWLAGLNADQAEYERLAAELARARAHLWDIWWLRYRPVEYDGVAHPEGFDEAAALALDPEESGPARQVSELLTCTAEVRSRIPYGRTPEELEQAVADYVRTHPLPEHTRLRRSGRPPFRRPGEPVVVVADAGTSHPLTRDVDDPLPCRVTADLLAGIRHNGDWQRPPARNAPDLTGLPPACKALLTEFALLDWAVRTPEGTGSVLSEALAAEDRFDGPVAEYTAPWQQAWVPMYLQWELWLCPLPYQSGGARHWELDDADHRWLGSGAPAGGGYLDLRWMPFSAKAFLAPTAPYVLREQVRRFERTYPRADTAALADLRSQYQDMDLLSQTLDGFNDWLLEQAGTAQLIPELTDPKLYGDPLTVPDPGAPGGTSSEIDRFQTVRAGQLYFRDLRIIDRFGRSCEVTNATNDNYLSFDPARATSVVPTLPIADGVTEPERFLQLPPRLMHPARVRLEPVPDGSEDPVVGWLLLNHIDRTLLVYAPDGAGLGELRVVGGGSTLAWNALPHAPFARPDDRDFAARFPQLSRLLVALLEHCLEHGPADFEALLDLVDQTLDTIGDDTAVGDGLPRLLGRPLLLVSAELELQLSGPPLTRPGWDHILDPPEEDYPTFTWPVRLGERDRLSDGLIGYYAGAEPGDEVSYSVLNTVLPPADSGYLRVIGNGDELALPACLPADPVRRTLTLLADPQAAVHAITGILPTVALRMPADRIEAALSRIRAAFRLDPLLAPVRTEPQRITSSFTVGPDGAHPASGDPELAVLLDGSFGTAWTSDRAATTADWFELDLGAERPLRMIELYGGDVSGEHLFPAARLEISTDGASWTGLAVVPAGEELVFVPAEPTVARRVRLIPTAASAEPVALRLFRAGTGDNGGGIVLPRPAAWYGEWTWAEPFDSAGPVASWATHPILPADTLAHPDDPLPTARAGYLQLRSTSAEETI
ncbi:discoidin domain-containing protein [Nocardia sp. NPDC001965]